MKVKTKIVAGLGVVTLLGLGMYTMSATEVNESISQESAEYIYDDISGHWAEKELKYFKKLGLMPGFEDGSMMPDAQMQRVDFLKLIVSVLGLCGEGDLNFYDISEYDAFYEDVKAAVASDVLDDGDEFRPYQDITVGEASDMLNRAISQERNVEVPFIKEAINKNNNYTSEDYITRGSVAHVLYEIVQKSKNSRSRGEWMPMELKYLIDMGYIENKWTGYLSEKEYISRMDFINLIKDAFDIDFKNITIEDKALTKEEMASIIAKLLKEKIEEVKDVNAFNLVFDGNEISEKLHEDVMYVLNAGLMKVDSACNFNPMEKVNVLDALKLVYEIKIKEELISQQANEEVEVDQGQEVNEEEIVVDEEVMVEDEMSLIHENKEAYTLEDSVSN